MKCGQGNKEEKHTTNQTHMNEQGDELYKRGVRLKLKPVFTKHQIKNLQYSQEVPCLQTTQCVQVEFWC